MNRRHARTTVVALTASVLSLGLLAACGDDSGDASSPVTVTREVTTDATPGVDATTSAATAPTTSAPATTNGAATTDAAASPVDAAGALEKALEAKPGSYAVEIDEEDGRAWEVTLVVDGKGLELTIDASTGQVSGERATSLDAEQHETPAVTAAEAIDAALAEKPGALDSLDLDRERGVTAWEATVIDGVQEWDIVIDASSGAILRADLDD